MSDPNAEGLGGLKTSLAQLETDLGPGGIVPQLCTQVQTASSINYIELRNALAAAVGYSQSRADEDLAPVRLSLDYAEVAACTTRPAFVPGIAASKIRVQAGMDAVDASLPMLSSSRDAMEPLITALQDGLGGFLLANIRLFWSTVPVFHIAWASYGFGPIIVFLISACMYAAAAA